MHSHLLGFVQRLLFALIFAFLVAAGLFIRRLPTWFRSLRTAGWLITEGRVESVTINTVSGQSLAEVAYSYLAYGERYSGYFFRQFADEQDAWNYAHPLKGETLAVRYNPNNPAASAIRTVDQTPLFVTAQPSLLGRLLSRNIPEILGLSVGKGDEAGDTKLAHD